MLPVVLCGNNAYSDQFQVFAHSFRKHNPDRRVVMFHSGDFDEALLARYGVESQIVHRLEGSSDRFNATHMHGALLRLVAFDWISRNWETSILYMDLDILVCGPVDEADALEVTEQKPIAGIDEYHALSSLKGNTNYALHRPLYWYQRHINRSYFNAGVMVVNTQWLLDKAVEKGFSSICECYEFNKYKWSMADQDCLNYLSPNQVLLPRSLNAMPELSIWFLDDFEGSEKLTESIRNSSVLHWVGKMKPWSSARQGSHTDPDRQMMPMDLYLEACDEIKDSLDPQFYRTVKINTTMWKSIQNVRC